MHKCGGDIWYSNYVLKSKTFKSCLAKFHTDYPLYKKKNYYEVLKVSPKSTKSQIKMSYYKLSMEYHPDQNKDEAAVIQYREIVEAYETLGNVTKRRLYDKGIYGLRAAATPEEAEAFSRRSSESLRYRPDASKKPYTGRTPIYDFDDWSKHHYTKNFERKQRNMQRDRDFKEYMKQQETPQTKKEDVIFQVTFSLLMIITAISFLVSVMDKDTPRKSYQKPPRES